MSMSHLTNKEAYYDTRSFTQGLAQYYARWWGPVSGPSLEVACGTSPFRPSSASLTVGVDHDIGGLRRRARAGLPGCVCDLDGPLPFQSDAFGSILAQDVLEHVEDVAHTHSEPRRILRPGGVVIVPLINTIPRRTWSDYTYRRGFIRHSLRQALLDHGFRVDDIRPAGPVPLATRLDLFKWVRYILGTLGLHRLWASSWEARAVLCV